MSCTPTSYLEASKLIQKYASDEGAYRAAAGRAYYAAYHRCRLYYNALPYLSKLEGRGVHEQLINALTIPSSRLSANGRARSVAIGKYLRDICNARVHADYRPEEAFPAEKMADSLSTAELIFSCTSVAKGPVQVEVSPLSR